MVPSVVSGCQGHAATGATSSGNRRKVEILPAARRAQTVFVLIKCRVDVGKCGPDGSNNVFLFSYFVLES